MASSPNGGSPALAGMRSLRAYPPAAILLVGCALVWNARSQHALPLAGSLTSVLREMPGYGIREQTLSEEEQRVAGMTSFVARAYVRDSAVAFMTLVSYYDRQTQGKTIHSPRNCLPGAGWEVVQGGIRTVTADGSAQTVNRYQIRNGRSTALAYYWYQGRGRVTADEYRVKWNLLRDAALAGHTEEALVRVVVPVAATSASATGADDPVALRDADAIAQLVATRLITEVGSVLPGNRARARRS